MSDIVIKAENLGKSYIIGHEKRERYTAMRDVIANKARQIASKTRQLLKGSQLIAGNELEEFWALKNLNFEISHGDRIGIIGRNGAGKSTLLKVISRITEPTTGRVTIRGRVASLLEVGTGFHPELTGRENIYLNGAILGMSRTEIKNKFDEIVNFAEVEKFLDTPVKRYSSGMYVRLAFSVAAHMEPEILVVDEVLAVGDAQFQKKCLGKMEDVSRNEGRTILFVSHNMAALKSICNLAIILQKGEAIFQGNIFEGITQYNKSNELVGDSKNTFERDTGKINKRAFFKSVKFVEDFEINEFKIMLQLEIIASNDMNMGLNIKMKDGIDFPAGYGSTNTNMFVLKKGANFLAFTSSPIHLAQGKYRLTLELVIPGFELVDKIEDCINFELNNETYLNLSIGSLQSWGFGPLEIPFKIEIN